jgi:hypothetical protein
MMLISSMRVKMFPCMFDFSGDETGGERDVADFPAFFEPLLHGWSDS